MKKTMQAMVATCAAVAAQAWGLTLGAAEYSRMTADLSALPREKAFLGEIVLKRATDRTRFSDKAGTLAVAFRLDGSLKGDEAAVTVEAGRAEVRAGRVRGLLFGAGELLRAGTWREDGFSLADGELAFRPEKPIRISYWARHFHNWYHLATAAELKEYAEDLVLWGVNTFQFQYAYPAVDAAGAIPDEVARFERISREVYAHLVAMDVDFYGSGGGNQAPQDSPGEFRGEPNANPKRGNLGFNVCPEKPGAMDYLLGLREKLLASETMKGFAPQWLGFWPYDEGGCGCAKCSPWGGRGYLRMCRRLSEMNAVRIPGVKHVLSTWVFDDDDWEGLYRYLATDESKWIDALMVDSHTEFPEYPLTHRLPRPVPIITFPEISMWGRIPWGGFGATALPARFERLFRAVERIVSGYMFYSEGRFEDFNKIVVTRLYANPSRHWRDIAREYCRWELPGVDPDDFARLVELLEKNHIFPEFNDPAEIAKDDYERRCRAGLAVAVEADELADRIERQISFPMRPCWRWRLFRLRAIIDREIYTVRDWHTPKADECYRELLRFNLSEPAPGLYRNRSGHGAVRPWVD